MAEQYHFGYGDPMRLFPVSSISNDRSADVIAGYEIGNAFDGDRETQFRITNGAWLFMTLQINFPSPYILTSYDSEFSLGIFNHNLMSMDVPCKWIQFQARYSGGGAWANLLTVDVDGFSEEDMDFLVFSSTDWADGNEFESLKLIFHWSTVAPTDVIRIGQIVMGMWQLSIESPGTYDSGASNPAGRARSVTGVPLASAALGTFEPLVVNFDGLSRAERNALSLVHSKCRGVDPFALHTHFHDETSPAKTTWRLNNPDGADVGVTGKGGAYMVSPILDTFKFQSYQADKHGAQLDLLRQISPKGSLA
jgi:hypothetical protein